jgi:hypothetical protein
MTTASGGRSRRGLRPLPLLHTGTPAPFRVVLPAYLAALAGWLAAAVTLLLAAPALADGAIAGTRTVLAAHLVGLVLFPFAVAAAVWQLLPVMLRNDPPRRGHRPLVLVLLAAGIPLAAAIAREQATLIAVCAVLLAGGLALLLGEIALLVRRAPRGKWIVVNRLAVLLAGTNAALAFALGAIAASDDGPEPLGVPYERFLLIHLSFALVGWLTVLIAAVGRTLVPMLGLAAAAPPRRVPAAELAIVAGLWLFVAGLALPARALVAAGILLMLAGLAPVARLFLRAAGRGTIGVREGPAAQAAVGLVFLGQAALLGLAAAAELVDGREAAIAAVLLLGLGWAAGMIVGHLGKLVSLSGWGSWPPGPRPRQAELYPRRPWQVEVVVFALGVQLLAVGVFFQEEAAARAGALVLAVAAAAALTGAGATVARVAARRRDPER